MLEKLGALPLVAQRQALSESHTDTRQPLFFFTSSVDHVPFFKNPILKSWPPAAFFRAKHWTRRDRQKEFMVHEVKRDPLCVFSSGSRH